MSDVSDLTPNELAQIKVELLAKDIRDCASALVSARANEPTRQFFSIQVEAELWSAKTSIDALLSELRATQEVQYAA